jgi:chorismate mutase
MNDQRVRAIRGAITVAEDVSSAVVDATLELLEQMIERNELAADDLVSIVLTATPDITSEFPAAAARKLGVSEVPLLCAQEMAVEGAMPRCIRILMHSYTSRHAGEVRHVYLGEARSLRPDLAE